ELLGRLREEIGGTDADDELEKLMRDLDDEIESVVDENADVSDLIDRAKEIEANFATRHPNAERFIREVIDLLVGMGI
ncbi:MAG: DUF4404 family protein, partial [Proteobacteria bacterium]|nr:DUF4404 family protein [Pseudomonadota bacterium]